MRIIYKNFGIVTAGKNNWTDRAGTRRGIRIVENFGGKTSNKGVHLKTWVQTGGVIFESLLK
jgi:hypothetical protein